ncbi:MAG: response regulator [Oscillibacter sp.]|nr:response regulator [Oscillibacter sp.]
MYHCHVRFYLAGLSRPLAEEIKAMPPLDRFTHSFVQSEGLEAELAAAADVIIAAAENPAAVERLSGGGELILLAEQADWASFSGVLERVEDFWPRSMSCEELRFRFRRWQERCRQRWDAWETHQFLEATINSVPNLVWYKDKNGIHEKVNDSFCKTVNKTKAQVQGRGHAYIWDVEHDDPACIESEREVMEKERTFVSEEVVQTGEGTRLLTTYKSPLYDCDGSVMGTVGVAIDVTQERNYEEEILRKNQTMETLFTTLDCGVMRHSLDGTRILSINRAALRILGYESEEELLAAGFKTVAPSVLEEDRERLRGSIQALDKVGDNVNIEYQVRHPDGKVLHVMGNVKLVQENEELFFQRFLLDITEQKLREERDREEKERRQAALVQALSTDYNLVCFFDREGSGTLLRLEEDAVLKELFSGGKPVSDCLDQYIERCVLDEDREELRRSIAADRVRKLLQEENTCYFNYRTFQNGETQYFQMKIVRTGNWEEFGGVVLGLRSVDAETRREMEKKAALEDALSQANRASRAKSTFLSNMSHDIRTPMNAIIGFTALAITHIDRQDQVEAYLKKIMTSGNHLLSLINDILDMSRIESGKMYLEEKPCSLPDILHGLRNIVQADIHAKQLELYVDAVDVIHEEIYCDRLRLNQVLLNLLGNSVKYTGAGGIVSLRIIEKPGAPEGCANYEFHIRDTGIGMSEEFVARIFEPFERERNSTTSGIQGTGLGMAITKNIVDMMNGTISVKSKQNVGTEFTVSFSFPLCDGEKPVQAIPELQNCRALVVDDDFNTCDSVTSMLQQIGLRAEWTLSGKEAVLRTRQAVMRNDNYSVYLLDWLLPDMNGIEVARRIRKEMGEQVPIIVLTAYDWSDIEDEAREAGVTAFCSKPLFLSELRSCLHSIVSVEEEEPENGRKAVSYSGRLLLAEDNELNQEIATAILEEAGFSVEVAGNGEIAVEMLKKNEPGYYRLILMDVQMPVLDGYGATRRIRKLEDPKRAEIPILAMTANAFEEDKQEALDSGMNGHVAKPIDIDKLMETLADILTE